MIHQMDIFTLAELAAISGRPVSTLRDWMTAGVLVASVRPPSGTGRDMLFSFRDAAIAGLVDSLRNHGLAVSGLKIVADTLRTTDWESAKQFMAYGNGAVVFVDDFATILKANPEFWTIIDFHRAISNFTKLVDERSRKKSKPKGKAKRK